MTRAERIEAALVAWQSVGIASNTTAMKAALDAAYPELASGTHVLVPREPTKALLMAGWPHFAAYSTERSGAADFAHKRYNDLLTEALEHSKPESE